MPVVECTSMSPSFKDRLHYLYYGSYRGGKLNQPHSNSNGVKVRNHLITGVNCRANSFKQACHDWQRALKQNNKIKNKSIQFVISFKRNEVNFDNKVDCDNIALLSRKLVKRAFGNNAIAVIALQDDNLHKTPHVHIDVANVLLGSGRAISGNKRNIYRIRSLNDDLIKNYNKRYEFNKPLISVIKPNYKHPHDKYLTKLARIIHSVAVDRRITSKSKFRRILKNKYHIKAHFIRPRKRKNGRKRRHKTYGVTFQYQTSPKIKGSKLNKIIPGIRYQNLVRQFRMNKAKNKGIKKQARSRSMATSKAFNGYSNEVSMYYDEYSFNNSLDKQDYSSEVSSAEDRFGLSADDVIHSAQSSSSVSKIYSTTSSAESIMTYVHAMAKNPFGSNEFFSSSTVSSAEDQIIFHPIPSSASESSSSSTSASSATPTNSSSNSIASANESAFNSASSASAKDKHERKIKHEKEVKQSRIDKEAVRLNRQTERYNQRSSRYYRQIPQADKDISSSSRAIRFGSKTIAWFTSKVSGAVNYVIDKTKAKFKEIIQSHRQKKLYKNKDKSDEIQP